MTRPVKFALDLVVGLIIASLGAWGADRLNRKLNWRGNAEQRSAAALERLADDADANLGLQFERRAGTLPPPSLLHGVEMKPIPNPDPEPCENAMTSKGADARFAQYACAQ